MITAGPKLSFEDVPGTGSQSHPQSICMVDYAEHTCANCQKFLNDPGPLIIGAMPGATCFGPAYAFLFILNTDLKRRKLRNTVPTTFVSREPYAGHMGLGGVGDSKTLIEMSFGRTLSDGSPMRRSPGSRPRKCL